MRHGWLSIAGHRAFELVILQPSVPMHVRHAELIAQEHGSLHGIAMPPLEALPHEPRVDHDWRDDFAMDAKCLEPDLQHSPHIPPILIVIGYRYCQGLYRPSNRPGRDLYMCICMHVCMYVCNGRRRSQGLTSCPP